MNTNTIIFIIGASLIASLVYIYIIQSKVEYEKNSRDIESNVKDIVADDLANNGQGERIIDLGKSILEKGICAGKCIDAHRNSKTDMVKCINEHGCL